MTRETTATPDTVWAVVTDLERSVDVLSGVRAIERLDDGDGFGVGTRWRETRVMFGREASEVLEVTHVDEASRRYVVEAHAGGTHYSSTLEVAPTPAGSRVRMTFGAAQEGLVGRVLARTVGRAFESATRKALAQDLDEIAAAAEADDAAAG